MDISALLSPEAENASREGKNGSPPKTKRSRPGSKRVQSGLSQEVSRSPDRRGGSSPSKLQPIFQHQQHQQQQHAEFHAPTPTSYASDQQSQGYSQRPVVAHRPLSNSSIDTTPGELPLTTSCQTKPSRALIVSLHVIRPAASLPPAGSSVLVRQQCQQYSQCSQHVGCAFLRKRVAIRITASASQRRRTSNITWYLTSIACRHHHGRSTFTDTSATRLHVQCFVRPRVADSH